jgi:uncharacterized protein YgiM (DUF1202 family)
VFTITIHEGGLMRIKTFLVFFGIMSVAIWQSTAQSNCPVFLQQTLQSVSENCENMTRNSVCYGNNQVRAEFISEVPEDFFTQPADRADIASLVSLITTSLSLTDEQWGVAVMNLQANVPNTLPGQAVTFVLLGDSEMENAVTPDEVFVPMDPILVRVSSDRVNVRSGPGTNFNILGTTNRGEAFATDARSADAGWVRVIYQGERVGWLSRVVLEENSAIDSLPVPDDSQRSVMQAFYLRTGVGRAECEEAPSNALMVQGPQNIQVNITVNGLNVQMGSTVMFRTTSDSEMEVTVLDGEARLTPDIPGAPTTIVQEGFSSVVCLGSPGNLGADGESNDQLVTCAPSEPQRDPEIPTDWCGLQELPENILNYAVDLQCPGDPIPPTPTPRPTTAPNTNNNNNNPRPIVTPTSNASTGTQLDCSRLTLIGPVNSPIGYPQLFLWNEVPGATNYVLDIFNPQQQFVANFNTGTELGTTVNLESYDLGRGFIWRVLAQVNGQTVCTSAFSPFISLIEPFTGSWSCIDPANYTVQISYSGATQNVTLQINGDSGFSENYLDNDPSTTINFSNGDDACGTINGTLLTSSGQSFTLPQIVCGSCPVD